MNFQQATLSHLDIAQFDAVILGVATIALLTGMGLILIAIAEMIGAKSGLGYMIWNAWEILSVDTMYVGLIMIAVIGYLFSLILNELEHWIIPWKVEH